METDSGVKSRVQPAVRTADTGVAADRASERVGQTSVPQRRRDRRTGARGPDGTDAHYLAGVLRSTIRDAAAEEPSRRDRWIRALNFVVALSAVILLSPLYVLVALAIRLDSHGPVLYRQVRVGFDHRCLGERGTGRRSSDRGRNPFSYPGADRRWRNRGPGRRAENVGGRPFVIQKFRTMSVDAEEGTGPVWASKGDQRVTRVGRWLRRYRVDEMPQFWNVLRGEMSIVGPRPERPAFVKKLRQEFAAYALRQRVPPGITGLAQVHRPPDQSIDDVRIKLNFDLEYCGRRSVLFDLIIMLRTLPAVLRRH